MATDMITLFDPEPAFQRLKETRDVPKSTQTNVPSRCSMICSFYYLTEDTPVI